MWGDRLIFTVQRGLETWVSMIRLGFWETHHVAVDIRIDCKLGPSIDVVIDSTEAKLI